MYKLTMERKIRVLSLSDQVVSYLHSPNVTNICKDVDLIIGCGDLPYYYLEFILSMLDVPLVFVRGNHDKVLEYSPEGLQRVSPHGGFDLHRQVFRYDGLLLAGVDGCLKYRSGPYQYTQSELWWYIFSLLPGVFKNKILYGRYLDFFVTHAPSAGIHDADDLPHQGIKAFRWFIRVFQPAYHFHGHVHIYRPDTPVESKCGATTVVNTYKYRITDYLFPG